MLFAPLFVIGVFLVAVLPAERQPRWERVTRHRLFLIAVAFGLAALAGLTTSWSGVEIFSGVLALNIVVRLLWFAGSLWRAKSSQAVSETN
jgi:heme A synthase